MTYYTQDKYFSNKQETFCFALVQHSVESGIRLRFWGTGLQYIILWQFIKGIWSCQQITKSKFYLS